MRYAGLKVDRAARSAGAETTKVRYFHGLDFKKQTKGEKGSIERRRMRMEITWPGRCSEWPSHAFSRFQQDRMMSTFVFAEARFRFVLY